MTKLKTTHNLLELENRDFERLPKRRMPPTKEQLDYNQTIYEWFVRKAKRFFSPSTIEKTLTKRRSAHSDEAVIQDFYSFEQPEHQIPEDAHFQKAIDTVTEDFRPHRTLHPVAYPDLRYRNITLSTNCEAPWNLQGWKFRPKSRNIDLESQAPKVSQGKEEEWKKLFERYEQWRMTKLFDWLSGSNTEPFNDAIDVDLWLRWKQQLTINQDEARSKHNLYPEILSYNRFLIHQIKDGEAPFWEGDVPVPYYWNTLHARSHVVEGHEPDKIRAVFGATWLLLLAELMFIWVLEHVYMNLNRGRMLWGREIMRGGWKRLRTEASNKLGGFENSALTCDWSQFDKRLTFRLMTIVFMIWRSYFDFNHYEETSFYYGTRSKTDESRIERLWTWVTYSILHTPILLPDNKLWKWTRNGFGSGYQMTQLMDSFANAIMLLTCLSSLGIDIKSEHFWYRVQGDDSVVAMLERIAEIYGDHFLDMLANAAMHYFNAKLNVKKSKISRCMDRHKVLGYLNIDGIAFRETDDLLSHLLFPESDFDNFQRKISVVVGLAYATCGTNDEFYYFLKYCYNKLKERGLEPRSQDLKWLKRTGLLYGAELGDKLVFPNRLEMVSKLYSPQIRTEHESEIVWPTKPNEQRQFYFLSQ